MTRMNKFQIGLDLNAIAMMVDDETFKKIKSRLDSIQEIVKNEPDDEEGASE